MAPPTPTSVQITPFSSLSASTLSSSPTVVVAEKGIDLFSVQHDTLKKVLQGVEKQTLKPLELKENGADVVTVWRGEAPTSLTVASFANKLSRYMGSLRLDTLQDTISKHISSSGTLDTLLVVVVEKMSSVNAAAVAVARCWPEFSRKTAVGDENAESAGKKERKVMVEFVVKESSSSIDYKELQSIVESVRLSARLVDSPPTELNPTAYTAEVEKVVKKLNTLSDKLSEVKMEVIRGETLREKGFGGLYGVGKAAVEAPALVHLSYTPPAFDGQKTIAWVGKGITYDTGGLSLKVGGNMVGMKSDMGGSAAVLGAFQIAVTNKVKHVIHAVLCLAENAIDAKSTKNDDILHMYSGKTVEINNTDAEGRLVLADGVAYASRHLKPDLVTTIATLTGAQLITTGTKHAGVLASTEEIESLVLKAGKASGEWVFPFLYAPQILMSQFDSQVADMKNSVKDRMNAQSACAGHFIESHLDSNYKNAYLHCDIAGPSWAKERGTGFGTTLLYTLAKLM